jgi:hypothetical protein
MKRNKETKTDLSRRNFIRRTAIGVGATALAGLGSKEVWSQERIEQVVKWEKEVDVVIVGYGLTGAVAAATAHDAGAKVLILEKMPKGREGGASRIQGNNIYLAKNKDCKDDTVAYFKGMCAAQLVGKPLHMSDISEEMVEVFAEEVAENREVLEHMGFGLKFSSVEHPLLPGSSTQGMYAYTRADLPNPGGLSYVFYKEVAARKEIEVLYNTPGKRLITTPPLPGMLKREVRGVVVETKGKEIAIKAKRAVILACGGYEFNHAMIENYGRAPMTSLTSPARTGDGILMAMDVGAELWHMNAILCPYRPGFLTDDLGPEWANTAWALSPSGKGFIWVDKYGKRFMDESRPHLHGFSRDAINYYDGVKIEYPRIPWWIVFDDTVRKSGAMGGGGWVGEFSGYKWTKDNSAEINKGWILKGDTIETLVAGMKVDPVVLAATVSQFNSQATAGYDRDFGRPAASMAPLKGPFYAIRAWPASVNTQGGPLHNEKCQVLDVWRKPIARLYVGGSLGSMFGGLYQGGGTATERLGTGRTSGKNAAAEKPWV